MFFHTNYPTASEDMKLSPCVIRNIFMVFFTVTVPVKVNILFCFMIKGRLDFLFFQSPFVVHGRKKWWQHFHLLFSRSVALQSTLHLRWFWGKVMGNLWIGGPWALSCMNSWWAVCRFLETHQKSSLARWSVVRIDP